MNIIKYEQRPPGWTLRRLKETRLRGFDRSLVYENAELSLVRQFNPNLLVPPQRYVMNPTLDTIRDLADTFEEKGIDVFALEGALVFWLEGMDPETEQGIPFLPPIVEESVERDGKTILLAGDGMHRVFVARERERRINIILATAVPAEWPYYAYGFQGGWDEVLKFDVIPDVFQKKDYRNPEGYKQLFRQYNDVFPGVQKERKPSNPAHIKQ